MSPWQISISARPLKRISLAIWRCGGPLPAGMLAGSAAPVARVDADSSVAPGIRIGSDRRTGVAHPDAAGTEGHGMTCTGTFKGLLSAVSAAAAAGGDPQLFLQRFKAGATLANFAGNVVVGNAVTNADNHGGRAGELSMQSS